MSFLLLIVQEMGFPQNQSEAAIQAYGTVQAALEALLAGKGKKEELMCNNSLLRVHLIEPILE